MEFTDEFLGGIFIISFTNNTFNVTDRYCPSCWGKVQIQNQDLTFLITKFSSLAFEGHLSSEISKEEQVEGYSC